MTVSSFLSKKLMPTLALFCCISTYGYTYKWGLSARQGDRPSMEDAHAHLTTFGGQKDAAFFAVYDGHSGAQAAHIAENKLHTYLDPKNNNVSEQLLKAFAKTEDTICKEVSAGSCAVTAYINDDNIAYFAWVGDSRAVVVRDGKVIFATHDHKPDSPAEMARIKAAGGTVTFGGVPRVNGYAIARALGDRKAKEKSPGAMIATPEIQQVPLQKGDTIILACDGIWDVLSNEQAAQIVCNARATSTDALVAQYPPKPLVRYGGPDKCIHEDSNDTKLQLIARALRDKAYNDRSTDNLSVQIIEVQ